MERWEKDDRPLEEHARWYPHCEYVQQMKGQEHIKREPTVEVLHLQCHISGRATLF